MVTTMRFQTLKERIRALVRALVVVTLAPACGAAVTQAQAEADESARVAACAELHTAGCELRIMTECNAGDRLCPAFRECQAKADDVEQGRVCR